jgi:hypothetical protein
VTAALEEAVEQTVDLNAVLPCEGVGRDGCPGEPVWAMRLHGCGHQVFLCAACREAVNHFVATHRGKVWFDHRPACEVRNYAWTWRQL